MRAVHLFTVAAGLALGASLTPIDWAPAQATLTLQAEPDESSARVGQPKYEDVKLEIDTAQPPKVASAIFLGREAMEALMPRKKAGNSAAGIKAK